MIHQTREKSDTKDMTLKEAVKKYVQDGDIMYYGGFTARLPMALTYELIRQRKRNLTIINASTDFGGVDLLIGAGCVNELHISWAMNWYVMANYCTRRSFKEGKLKRYDVSNFAATSAMMAGYLGIPFIPIRGGMGSDIPRYNQTDLRTVEDPWTGEQITVVRSWVPDVAIISAQRGDSTGNIQSWGTRGVTDEWAGCAAKRGTIATVEKIVSTDITRRDPDRTIIPFYKTLALTECPWNAHPSQQPGFYNRDIPFVSYQGMYERAYYLGYDDVFQNFLDEWIHGCEDREEYIKHYISKFGRKGLRRLRVTNHVYPTAPVDYGWSDPLVFKGVKPYTDKILDKWIRQVPKSKSTMSFGR
jgi:glutaconate CoA-transferase subunit A